jgi:hypothetical protein
MSTVNTRMLIPKLPKKSEYINTKMFIMGPTIIWFQT